VVIILELDEFLGKYNIPFRLLSPCFKGYELLVF